MSEDLMIATEDVEVIETEDVEVIEEERKDWQEQPGSNERSESWLEHILDIQQADQFQSRWNSIQIAFVDEPRSSVEQADALVVEAVEKITRSLYEKRDALGEQFLEKEDTSTEDLRIALQSYRTLFNHLLTL